MKQIAIVTLLLFSRLIIFGGGIRILRTLLGLVLRRDGNAHQGDNQQVQ